MKKELSEQEMLHRAAAYCSAAERCKQDVEKKILAAGLDDAAADRIIGRLIQERFIDEERFCRFFVGDKLRFNQWGRIKIRYELKRKGIPETACEEALAGIDEEEYENILAQILATKKKSLRAKDPRDGYYKLMRFAAGRGFEPQLAGKCIKRLLGNQDYEDDLA